MRGSQRAYSGGERGMWFKIRLLRVYEGLTEGLGMDALVTVFSWNTNGIMVGAWML